MTSTIDASTGEPTEAEEKLRLEREEREREEAAQQLSFPFGGTAPTKFRVQVTGGAIDLPAALAGRFQKDEDVEIVVRGWVKTEKVTTEKRGETAVREAVVVAEEIEVGG